MAWINWLMPYQDVVWKGDYTLYVGAMDFTFSLSPEGWRKRVRRLPYREFKKRVRGNK